MPLVSRLAGMVAVIALGACAELGAPAPLFTPANQIGPPPLTEGIWIGVGEHCPERNTRRSRFPKDCVPLELSQIESGAWTVRVRVDLITGLTADERVEALSNAGPFEMLVVPAVEHVDAESYAPLYVGELHNSSPEHSVGYIIIAPLGALPATTALVSSIGCSSILREGPIEGVTPNYREIPAANGEETGQRELTGCTASTQAAVRIAARRTAIEDINTLVASRYIFVRGR